MTDDPPKRRGQVWATDLAAHTRPGNPLLLVVSDAIYNQAHPKRPIVVRLYVGQLDPPELPPEVIPTGDGDPVRGHVIAYEVARPHVSKMALLVGELSSATMAHVDTALRDLFGL